jgi:GR25 family glycosyltransferase involved in LPS biosynthesis
MKKELLIDILKLYKVKLVNIKNVGTSDLNERVEQIYVINMIQDVRKRNYIIILMKKYGINFTLVLVDYVPNSIYNTIYNSSKMKISKEELGCCLSHLWCLNKIIVNKCKNAIIFEDDIILHKNFITKFNKIYDDNTNVDFLLLGAQDQSFSTVNYKHIHKGLYKPEKSCSQLYGAHANYYSLNGAQAQFNIRTASISFFDKEYSILFNKFKESYVCYPNLAVANITTSSLTHTRPITGDMELEYYNRCFLNFNFKQYNFIYINLLNNASINKNDTYKTFTENYLYEYLHDFNKIEIVKNRLVMNFFTLDDIQCILKVCEL